MCGRAKGQKNLLPSRRDRDKFLRKLRTQAEKGSPAAAGALLMLGTLRDLARELRGETE